jgi:hypothetical protein
MKTLLLSLLLIYTSLSANVWSDSDIERISKDHKWLKLLHYDSKVSKSAIHDKSFFLDKEGEENPKKELIATLNAYGKPFDINGSNEHAKCRFPARYYWLSTQLKLPKYSEVNGACRKLTEWKLLKNTDSLSVVFVSGYLGNPASAFGHSFIKVNQSKDEKENLFDTSISYGALLPPKYNMPEYIFNGLTGGYEAAYSDKYYYNQDITYSNQEFRDMWEYRLKLSDSQKKLFLLHAWELMGKKNQYFFLNRNCGYKVSEFLGLLFDEPLIESAYIWYAPIETFYKLKEMDRESNNSIIDRIIYIPSKQQKIYTRYKELSSIEKKILTIMIEEELSTIPDKFYAIDKVKQSNVLDFLLAYRKYKFEKNDIEPDKETKSFNRTLILNRLKLPMSKGKHREPDVKKPITENSSPSFLGVGVLEKNDHRYTTLHFSPFAIEREGYNDFSGDELVVLDTEVHVARDALLLNRLDLIRIQRLKTKQLPYDSENPLSWNLHIGTQRDEIRDYFLDAGAGYAWEMNGYMKLYSMLNLSLHREDRKYRYRPNIGLYGNFDKLRLTLNLGYEKDIDKKEAQKIFNLKSQYKVDNEISLFMEYENEISERILLGLKWFY